MADTGTEIALWASLQNGEPGALSDIFEQYHSALLRYGMALCQDKELVKDCIQELFMHLWQQHAQLSAVQSLHYYLIVSLRRLVIRKLQQERKTGRLSAMAAAGGHETVAPPAQEAIISAERRQERSALLKQAVHRLPRRQREAIFLRFYEELDYPVIADIMHLNYQGVRNIIYRAVKALQKSLNAHGEAQPGGGPAGSDALSFIAVTALLAREITTIFSP